MINSFVMLNKRDAHVPKLMGAIVNELIPIVKINKLNICLAPRTRLNK
jgi:hypothetical protein